MVAKILIIDDDPSMLQLLELILAENGYQVIVANSGMTGIAEVVEQSPDLMIVDMVMPWMSGIEVCEHIRVTLGITQLPIIMLSANSDAPDPMQIGIDEYIAKPVKLEILLRRVAELLRIYS